MATVQATTRSSIPPGTWSVDPVHSHIGFKVVDTQELFSAITGRFTDFEGAIDATDPENPKASGVVRAASVTTDQEQRDAHLRSPDFFDAGKFPEIRFESARIESLEGGRVRVTGRLSMKHVPQDIVLEGRVVSGNGPDGGERLIFQSGGELHWGPMTVAITADVTAAKAA